MAQVFPPVVNTLSRVTVLGFGVLLAGLFWVGSVLFSSPYVSRVGVAPVQPIGFSHEVHAGGLGLDCRYCHTTVETSAFAGLPATKTCMGCHSQVLADSPYLALVRASDEEDRPIPWVRVHDLPDFVHFDHSIHVAQGIGCSSCHGRVDRMARVAQGSTLEMRWCLDCHRHPERQLRDVDDVFDPAWKPPPDQEERGRRWLVERGIRTEPLTDCSMCHQ